MDTENNFIIEQDYSKWTNELINQIISDSLIENQTKIKLMDQYIKWRLSDLTQNHLCTYPVINLFAGYYGLITSKTSEQINEMINKAYDIEFVNSINKITNTEILSGLTLINFMCNIINYSK